MYIPIIFRYLYFHFLIFEGHNFISDINKNDDYDDNFSNVCFVLASLRRLIGDSYGGPAFSWENHFYMHKIYQKN